MDIFENFKRFEKFIFFLNLVLKIYYFFKFGFKEFPFLNLLKIFKKIFAVLNEKFKRFNGSKMFQFFMNLKLSFLHLFSFLIKIFFLQNFNEKIITISKINSLKGVLNATIDCRKIN